MGNVFKNKAIDRYSHPTFNSAEILVLMYYETEVLECRYPCCFIKASRKVTFKHNTVLGQVKCYLLQYLPFEIKS